MGGTFVAVADDPSAIFWNPAGLASLQRREVQASHVDWPAEVSFDHLTLVLPSAPPRSIGVQFGVLDPIRRPPISSPSAPATSSPILD
jgi:hypothetical protein